MSKLQVTCQYCNKPAVLVQGDVIYAHRPDLAHLYFWQCEPCNAYVGCHKAGNGHGDGTTPLGILANAELRKAKSAVHAKLDPLWKNGSCTRREAYAMLAKAMGIPSYECHIGMFTLERCKQALLLLSQ
ncbi:hypothetical protein FROZEN_20 [Erwinia phage vB_EamP_Frozen]|uniref:Uncharacterized protein n=2 Tax=Johnsonvirus frozen TaxID=1982578 RepID=A0A191ZDD5_9CAUD|nr:hypothetical protein FROZEN_20 [Erwinia phage vB_EamP_Frozen]ANJ65152.1 hypothetical protein FROZEN_20 [Erwinia phage vB_EamP_Frozen]ANJ65397.1 hypothetical protein GUTMEISTER_20 [Erwinia phage vB_EamP_Gutmeister]